MRSDKAKNLAKVASARARKPLASQREIAEDTGIDHRTVGRLDIEMPQIAPKIDSIQNIIKKDMEIVELGIEILKQRMDVAKADDKAMSTRDVISATDLSAKRYSLFKGSATDKEGGLKEQVTIFNLPDNSR